MASRLEILISAKDKATKTLRGVSKTLKALNSVAKKSGRLLSNVFGKVKDSVFNLKTAILSLSGVAGFVGLTKSILKTGGAFEDYKATLKVVLGTQEKANKAFAWVKKFAKETPFNVDQLTASFVKLSAYGIDGTKVMRTLGDTAAGMGKDINMAVEALADAQTGEFERLKEFGIKAVQITKSNAKAMGATMKDVGQTALSFTDKIGKQQIKVIDRNNRKMITSTLLAIWNERYAGAMEERSKTMNGMLSNLGDSWTNFKNLVAEKLLPIIKEKLTSVLDKLKEWNKDGTLENWANGLADGIGKVLTFLSEFIGSFTKDFELLGKKFSKFTQDMTDAVEAGKSWGKATQDAIYTVMTALGLMEATTLKTLTGIDTEQDKTFKNMQDSITTVVDFFGHLNDTLVLIKAVCLDVGKVVHWVLKGLVNKFQNGIKWAKMLWNFLKKISGWKPPKVKPPEVKSPEKEGGGDSEETEETEETRQKTRVASEPRGLSPEAIQLQNLKVSAAQEKSKNWGNWSSKKKGSRASGGGVDANQPYMVGEQGAEMFTPTTSGVITPSVGNVTNVTNIFTAATAHGINNALASRGDGGSRSGRNAINVSKSRSAGGHGNLSGGRR
nr:hypothetical protein [Rhodospirillales bacterium]